MTAEYVAAKAAVRADVEKRLAAIFDACSASEVRDAARYATLGGGNRWRAMVSVAAGRIFHDDPQSIVLPGSCGVELAHAASMMLDDMPSMDNAPMRRGKPAVHRAFAPWIVDLTPVFLVNLAYRVSLDNPLAQPERRIAAAMELSAAGAGMIDGQSADIKQEHARLKDSAGLIECYRGKSGVLYAAAAAAGGILCGADNDEAAALRRAGYDMGVSYQLLDDVADATVESEEIGKRTGVDRNNGKWTSIDWLGVEGALKKGIEFQERGVAELDRFGPKAEWLRLLIREASYKAFSYKDLKVAAR